MVLPVTGLQERLTKARICKECGFIHDDVKAGVDVCEHCGTRLDASTSEYPQRLLEQPPILTRAIERILSDEEGRIRSGYHVTTHFRFESRARVKRAIVKSGDTELLEIIYAPAAQLWRINHGWRRGQDTGFTIDARTGRWQRRDTDVVTSLDESKLNDAVTGVKPFVKDSRNILLVKPLTVGQPTREFLTSLQHALKRGIQFVYQVEEQEISAELIGRGENWRIILWEAAEGGTGISEFLANDKDAVAKVAERAFELCHFTQEENQADSTTSRVCSAACYECLLSYTNQNEHRFIDRNLRDKPTEK